MKSVQYRNRRSTRKMCVVCRKDIPKGDSYIRVTCGDIECRKLLARVSDYLESARRRKEGYYRSYYKRVILQDPELIQKRRRYAREYVRTHAIEDRTRNRIWKKRKQEESFLIYEI